MDILCNAVLKGLDIHVLGRFLPSLQVRGWGGWGGGEANFVIFCLLSWSSSENKSALKGKNMLRVGENSPSLEYTHFQKAIKLFRKSYLPWKCISSPKLSYILTPSTLRASSKAIKTYAVNDTSPDVDPPCEKNIFHKKHQILSSGIWGQRRPRSACASLQSDQGLCRPKTELLYNIECFNRGQMSG